MQLLFSTETVHLRDRFDYWHSVACRNIVQHDCEVQNRNGFVARISSGSLGHLTLLQYSNSRMQVFRRAQHAAAGREDELLIRFQISGSVSMNQNGRHAQVNPGMMILLDPRFPFEGDHASPSETLTIKAPRAQLEARIGRCADMTARAVTGIKIEDSLTLSLLSSLPSMSENLSHVAQQTVANHVLDLVALSVSQAADSDERMRSSKGLLLARISSAIDSWLIDPKLDVQKVAAEVGITVRYANLLLSQQDTSVKRLITARRLARCRHALDDAGQAHRTVSEIALGWGFSDMSHFARRFKAAYGMLPSEYRVLKAFPTSELASRRVGERGK